MSRLRLAKVVCHAVSVVLALASAIYWFRASAAKVTKDDKRYDVGIDMRGHDPKNKNQPLYVAQTVVKQSMLNKIAAILMGLAVLLDVAAKLIPSD
jgi:hypothetical protein